MSKLPEDIYKPFDIVTDNDGNMGFITEVSLEYDPDCDCTTHAVDAQYAVYWLVGKKGMSAWYTNSELILHCNMFVEMAKAMCNDLDDTEESVEAVFGMRAPPSFTS